MIDLHAHVVLERTLGAAGELGPELDEGDESSGRRPSFRVGDYVLEGIRYRGTPFMDVDVRLAQMDERGVELAVLSPNPLTFLAGIDPEPARHFSRRHNDGMAELVASRPSRLAGFAQLPTQDVAAAVDELHRAVSEMGLLGAYIATDVGRPLDDPALDPLYTACCRLDVPLFLHPAPGGIDSPRRDERLKRFDADLWLGFAHEEAIAVATLVLGGVLSRHPSLDICVSHGGGSTALLAERMAHAARTRGWATPEVSGEGDVEELLGRIWWDGHVAGPVALEAVIAAFGDSRVVGGTNFAGWDDHAGVGVDERRGALFDANATRLLRLG